MSNPVEITRDITVAWLSAYQTDLSIRRQKGMVPLFTPTYEEVMNFVKMTYENVKMLESASPEPEKQNTEKPQSKTRKKS